ncbi:hypothetical protein R6Q57_026692 [Mikania cordata]
MKREGRQHGFVRSYPTPLSRQRRYVKTVDSASVAGGLFTKVSTKPTNHSKFTGKCGTPRCLGCHIHPVCKSKHKAKATMKLRSDHRLIDCPSGTSSIDALAYIASVETYDDDAIDDYNDDANIREEVIGVEDEDECVSYCDVGLYWGDGEGFVNDDDGWYLVAHDFH